MQIEESAEKRAYAYLRVTSETLTLPEISNYFEIQPDRKSWSIGDFRSTRGATHLRYEFSCWSLSSGVANGATLEVHLSSLFNRIEPFHEKIDELPAHMSASISTTGWLAGPNEPVVFTAGTLRQFGIVGLSVDFDLYFDD